MTDLKITQLPVAAALDGTELFECIQSADNKKTPISAIATLVAAVAIPDTGYSGMIEAPIVKTYSIDLSVPVACHVEAIKTQLVSGTLTAKLQKNGADIAGSTVSATSSVVTGTCSGANASFAAGDKLTMLVTAVSSPIDLAFSIEVSVP